MILIIELENIIKKYYNFQINHIEKNIDSTDGNVYIIDSKDKKYVVKIYDDINHVKSIIKLHNNLLSKGLIVPNIIKTNFKTDENYIKFDNKFIVVYSFLEGKQINQIIINNVIDDKLIVSIAKEIRKLHDATQNNNFELEEISFANNLQRKSVLHFDLTKDNIFINNEEVGFIDFDDAKYGDSICDVAIAISLLFISKKRGIDYSGIKLFIKSYYGDDIDLMKEEVHLIQDYATKWLNYLLNENCFDTSTNESFEYKLAAVKNINIEVKIWMK